MIVALEQTLCRQRKGHVCVHVCRSASQSVLSKEVDRHQGLLTARDARRPRAHIGDGNFASKDCPRCASTACVDNMLADQNFSPWCVGNAVHWHTTKRCRPGSVCHSRHRCIPNAQSTKPLADSSQSLSPQQHCKRPTMGHLCRLLDVTACAVPTTAAAARTQCAPTAQVLAPAACQARHQHKHPACPCHLQTSHPLLLGKPS